jgi:hypothetical protein
MPFLGLDVPIQRGSRDLERPANLLNWVPFVVEILGYTQLFTGERFWPAASSSSGSGCTQSCYSSLPDQVSLKLRKRTKDLAATGC